MILDVGETLLSRSFHYQMLLHAAFNIQMLVGAGGLHVRAPLVRPQRIGQLIFFQATD